MFQAEDQGREIENEVVVLSEDQELAEAAEMIASEFQERGSEDDEEALEAFESYMDIRRKLREQKTNRGYRPNSGGNDQWKLSGTVKGKLELLKAKTTCHLCRQRGHWKRECPNRKTSAAANSFAGRSSSELHSAEGGMRAKEVLLADDELWHRFEIGSKGEHSVAAFEVRTGSPTPEKPNESFVAVEVLVNDQNEQVPIFDSSAEAVAVPDIACRRTLIGAYTLRQLEQHLLSQGLKVARRSEQSEFRLGNEQTLTSTEAVVLPACVNGSRFLIRAAVLPNSWTPLLLSKEFLRQLECVLDLSTDRLWMFGHWVSLVETEKGHYGLRCFDFGSDCWLIENRKERIEQSKECRVSSDSCRESWLSKKECEKKHQEVCPEKHGLYSSEPFRDGGGPGDVAQHQSRGHTREWRLDELHEGTGCDARCCERRSGTSRRGESELQGRKVQDEQQDSGEDLYRGEGLYGVGETSYRCSFRQRDTEAQALHRLSGCSQTQAAAAGDASSRRNADAASSSSQSQGPEQEHGSQS